MFIYKITVVPLGKVYIGLDTKPEYKKSRWRTHCKESLDNPKGKLHKAIHQYGPNNCAYEVIETGFESISKLALAEIKYIKEYDSYRTGLNSTPGGDGLNNDLTIFTEKEIAIIKEALGEKWKLFNKKKWEGTTVEQRQEMIKHCHTADARKNKSDTLKGYYTSVDGAKEKHCRGIKQWQKENPELARQYRIQNGLKGAQKTSKKVTLIRDNGTTEVYTSISEFQRKTGQWISTIRKKSAKGEFYNGYKLKDENE